MVRQVLLKYLQVIYTRVFVKILLSCKLYFVFLKQRRWCARKTCGLWKKHAMWLYLPCFDFSAKKGQAGLCNESNQYSPQCRSVFFFFQTIIQRLLKLLLAGKGQGVQHSPTAVIHLVAVPSLHLLFCGATFPADFCMHGWLHHCSSAEDWLTFFTVLYAWRLASLIWWQINLNRKIYSDIIPRTNP